MATRTRWLISPMSGPLPATPPHAIRTGSWLAREARIDVRRLRQCIAVLTVAAVLQLLLPYVVLAAHRWRSRSAPTPHVAERSLPYPLLDMPIEISGSQYMPLAWSNVPGWSDDDQLAAFQTFRASCKSIAAQHDTTPAEPKALGGSLR